MTAILSDDGIYRYQLERFVQSFGERVLWIMFNPSTADAETDDPTIRRVVGFSRLWGFGAARVVNMFAFRSTVPARLGALFEANGLTDVVGPENDQHITRSLAECRAVVPAWGALPRKWPWAYERTRKVVRMLQDCPLRRLRIGRTKMGDPRHPLMAPYGPAEPIT